MQSLTMIATLYFTQKSNLNHHRVYIASTPIGKRISIRWPSFPMCTHLIVILWSFLIFLIAAIPFLWGKSLFSLKGSQVVNFLIVRLRPVLRYMFPNTRMCWNKFFVGSDYSNFYVQFTDYLLPHFPLSGDWLSWAGNKYFRQTRLTHDSKHPHCIVHDGGAGCSTTRQWPWCLQRLAVRGHAGAWSDRGGRAAAGLALTLSDYG